MRGTELRQPHKTNNDDDMSWNVTMAHDADDHFALRLANAIRHISALMGSGASCADIGSAAVQCTSTILYGSHAMVLEISSDHSVATPIAASNAPFVKVGEEIPLPAGNIMVRALEEPHRAHRSTCDEADEMFPTRRDYPGEAEELIACKAVPRSSGQLLVLVIVANSEIAASADGLLMTLSELLMALCAGHEASVLHSNSLVEIARAKHEWERTVDALPELVCLVDKDGYIVRSNRMVERWGLGNVYEAPGQQIHELLHNGCVSPDCRLQEALAVSLAAQTTSGHMESVISDGILGRTLNVRIQLMPELNVSSDQSTGPMAVVVIADVSALQRAQKELGMLNRDLEKRVQKRTQELEKSNAVLSAEIKRRRIAEEKLQTSRDELAVLSEQLLNTQEEERRRISRELHDSLGQSLGAIKYSLERVSAMQDDPAHGNAGEEVGAIIETVTRTIRDTRSMAMTLRPPILDDMGAVSAVGWLCQHFSNTYDDIEFRTEFSVADEDVPAKLATPIYRIVQEALNNVVKHSSADSVLIAMRADDGVLKLQVLDDGIGFDSHPSATGQLRRLGHFGRLGMRERAVNSNGSLNIRSRPWEGTAVLAEWPLEKK